MDAQTLRATLSELSLADAARQLGYQDVGALLAAMREHDVKLPEMDPVVAAKQARQGQSALDAIRRK